MSDVTTTGTEPAAQRKRELLAKLLREKAGKEIKTGPLSYGQRALSFMYQLVQYHVRFARTRGP